MANKLKTYLADPFLLGLYTDICKAGPIKSISVDITHTCNTRCTGVDRDCDTCFDTWEHFPWVMLNLKKHLGSKQEFTNWLITTYLFYMINRIVDFEEGIKLLPEIHRRVGWVKKEHENTHLVAAA